MTIIVYQNGIIAADTQTTDKGLAVSNHAKIARNRNKDLAGAAGSVEWCARFLKWFSEGENGPPPVILDSRNKEGNHDEAFIVRNRSSRRWCLCLESDSETPYVLHFREQFGYGYAIGSGSAIACGAMIAGADPVAAVKAAIAMDNSCGGSVVTMGHESEDAVEWTPRVEWVTQDARQDQ